MDENDARKLFMKAKIYRLIAMVFLAVGLIVFVYLYNELAQGNFFQLLNDPASIFLLLIPFLPSFVLSYMAERVDKKLHVYFESKKNQ